MRVKLLAITPNPIEIIYTACRTCYSELYPSKIFDEAIENIDRTMQLELIDSVIKSGHLSVVEHINFTFAIEGVSRALSHQFVRHRHMSPSQQSQRYVQYDHLTFVVPHSISKTDIDDPHMTVSNFYEDALQECFNIYEVLTKEYNIPAEDARMVLPNATPTNLVATMNLRELIHVCNLRLCTHAQEEIRDMVTKMKIEVGRVIPEFKPYLVPECEALGFCPQQREPRGCRRPTREKLLKIYEDHKDDSMYKLLK